MSTLSIINANKIQSSLVDSATENPSQIREILAKALEFKGLNLQEVAQLTTTKSPELLKEIFAAANRVKEEIYGRRVVIFAPLYVSNLCSNECLYCAFRVSNRDLKRRVLSLSEIKSEVESLVNQGHKRLLLVSGETYPQDDFQYILDAIKAVYEVANQHGEIRRVNVNLAPLDTDDFKRLKDAAIGTYQLFQETYHRDTYSQVHVSGKKADYDWRLSVFDRAIPSGIDDVGIGALFGLYDWRFEVLALLEHSNYLQNKYGVGPHTISVPRLEPALGSHIASHPLAPVSDIDFCKIVAILRLAIPYTGIIMSTRESLQMRQQTLALGVSQISAGSRTNPGGYSDAGLTDDSQFSLGDHRSLDDVVRDVASLGYIPSFCTACYRLGRTGEDFMGLAKHGNIKQICAPNAIATFAEYLNNTASEATKIVGHKLIQSKLELMSDETRNLSEKLLARLASGQKDVYV
ncbi:MAG: [FeFe] hydrogenase H-cluster radical SAM maturase HydG [Gammaproteobacteria bacterium]|nr:[FeFe] hydrogenase H-cluster radical SAM maturase HydG [Gammaproteobacteria bacterium]